MNKLKNSLTYIAGPIDNCASWEDANDWRDDITEFLRGLNIGVMNPCNKPSGDEESPSLAGDVRALKREWAYDEASAVMKEICRVDLRMVSKSDFLIAHLDMSINMCGTFHEIVQAKMNRIPVLIHCEQGKSEIPNWLFGTCNHNDMFSSWGELKERISKIDSGEIKVDTKHWHFFDNNKIFGKA